MELQTRMRGLLHCRATVTICLVTKLLPLFGPSILCSQSCFQSAPISSKPSLTFNAVFVLLNSAVETFATMATTLQEQAWQSGLVISKETAEWNEADWPPLEGGWRVGHASVVLNHPDNDDDINNKGQTVIVLGGYQAGQGQLNSVLLLNLADQNKQWREGPPMNKKRDEHSAVVCNGDIYVVGGYSEGLHC